MTKPLDGTTILDLSHALAGPFCMHHLGLLGAEVIKVEQPGSGDDFRARVGPKGVSASFVAVNAGKRSITLNLKSAAGLEALRRLVARADVLVENFRPGVAAKLGLDWDSLCALNPRLVYCSISGYGQTGELRDRPAIEWSVQAASGMTTAYVAADADPMRLGVGVVDPYTGYMAFASILAALLQRARTGVGQRIVVGSGFRFEHDGLELAGHVPALGEHTAEILREVGYPDDEIVAMKRQGVT